MELANAFTHILSAMPAPAIIISLALAAAITYACIADWRAHCKQPSSSPPEYDHEYEEDIYD